MTTWSCAARERFLVRSWSGEEGVVFDMLSGDTHLLEPLALELLHRLDPAVTRSAPELLDDLADFVEDTPPESALAAVEHSLESMRRVGLVIASPA
jgi:PqqD family protein of HPr-rel-A system